MSNVHQHGDMPPSHQHSGQHSQHDHQDNPPSFWKSKSVLVLVAFAAIATFLLLSEHRAHFLGALPYMLILACPLLHIFMHGGHGGHGGHGDHQIGEDKSKSVGKGDES